MAVELVLYSRPGCHLCDEMLSELNSLDDKRQLHVTVVNIDDDPALRNAFSARIPVLARADTQQVLSEHYLDKAAVLSCMPAPRSTS